MKCNFYISCLPLISNITCVDQLNFCFYPVQLIARSLSAAYVEKMVEFLAIKLEASCHLQFYLTWCSHLLTAHGGYLKEHSASIMSKLRDLQKSIVEKQNDLGSL